MTNHLGPVAIGGIGGSGTRVYSEIVQKCGFYFGGCQNPPLDSLAFTLMFKRLPTLSLEPKEFGELAGLLRDVLLNVFPSPRQREVLFQLVNDDPSVRQDHKAIAIAYKSAVTNGRTPHLGRWGWKEPNTHIVADRLIELWPEFRYIHVYRDGRDMALSANQNQLKFWGPRVLKDEFEDNLLGSLKYLSLIHI